MFSARKAADLPTSSALPRFTRGVELETIALIIVQNTRAGAKLLGPEYAAGEVGESSKLRPTEADPQQELPFVAIPPDAPLCSECGSIMTRNGSCYKCGNCGGTSGCS
jgi:hypothetical protein